MKFLKELFGDGALTFDQLGEKLKTAGKDGGEMKLADLSQGQYVGIEKYHTLETDRDAVQKRLDDAADELKALDGADVGDLREKISTLEGELQTQKESHAQNLADRDFNDLLTAEITAAKGVSPRAITALLDIDTLKASKNQKEDIGAALKALQESDPNQFKSEEKPPFATGGTGDPVPGGDMQSIINAQLGIKT